MSVRVAGYVRVSTEEQKNFGWNLEADRERIKATVAAHIDWVLTVIYDDGGRQGEDPTRPGFLRMLAEVEDYDIIIMRDLDRLGRATVLSALAFDTWKASNVLIHEFSGDEGTATRKIDVKNEDDRALAEIKSVFAQLEKAKIKRRVRQAKAARARAGMHPGGRRPFGYELVGTGRLGAHDKEIKELRPHPVEREAVLRIFERADGGMSQRRIAHTLNLEGVRSVNGLRWSQATVARLLTNPLYIGQLRRGVCATKLIKGKSKKVRVGEEVSPGQHEGILDLDLFNRATAAGPHPNVEPVAGHLGRART
jgi:site-specific DNA recombinase